MGETHREITVSMLVLNCRNSTKDIYVSHVDTPIRFFVNVDEEDADQSDLSDFRHGISIYNDYFVHSPMKFISDEKVHDNLAVWCQTECGDEWERGLVVGEPSKNGRVNVFCVDNGETRQVRILYASHLPSHGYFLF